MARVKCVGIAVRRAIVVVACGLVFGCASSGGARDQAQRRLERAVAERERAEAESAEAYDQAIDLIAQENYAEAIPLLVQSVTLSERNLYAWTALGQARFALDDIQGALIALSRASEVGATHALAHYNEGVVLQAAGRYHRASEVYESALALDPDLLEAIENLARCYTLLRIRPERVRELVDQALLTENRPDWRIWLQRTRQNLNKKMSESSLSSPGPID